MAILCVFRWCYVLPSCERHVPPLFLPFSTDIVLLVADRLCRHCGTNRFIILPTSKYTYD